MTFLTFIDLRKTFDMVDRDLRLRHEDIVGTVAAGRQRLGIQKASTERMQTHRRDETWSKVKQIHQTIQHILTAYTIVLAQGRCCT